MKALDERQLKLKALKKFEKSDKWQSIQEELINLRDSYWDAVLQAYWVEWITEVPKFNHKNKAIWWLEVMTDFLNSLWTGEAEDILVETVKKRIEDSENYIRFQIWMDQNFTRPTEVVFTDTDKLAYKCQVLKDLAWMLARKIKEYEKEKDTTKVEEDTQSQSDDPYSESDV